MNLRKDWVYIYWLVLSILSVTAFIFSFIAYDYPDIRYFTIDTNLGVLCWLILAIMGHQRVNFNQKLKGVFRGAVTLYITVTFLIFSTLLYDGSMTYSSLIFHYIIPIAFIFEWFFTESDKKYKWRYLIVWMIFPLIYLGGVIINGSVTGFYPYPFFDIPRIGISNFIIMVLFLVVLFVGLGIAIIALNQAIYKIRAKKQK